MLLFLCLKHHKNNSRYTMKTSYWSFLELQQLISTKMASQWENNADMPVSQTSPHLFHLSVWFGYFWGFFHKRPGPGIKPRSLQLVWFFISSLIDSWSINFLCERGNGRNRFWMSGHVKRCKMLVFQPSNKNYIVFLFPFATKVLFHHCTKLIIYIYVYINVRQFAKV